MPDASGYVERTETLALRKELGSWSDVTGVQDVGTGLWVTVRFGSVYDVSASGRLSLSFKFTLALWKDLGSGSDMTECKMVEKGFGEAWVTQGKGGECEIQFQDYSEAIVVSMVILEFQATGQRLDIEADGVGSGDMRLWLQDYSEAELISSKIYRNIEMHLEFAFDTDVREMARLSFRFTLRRQALKLMAMFSEIRQIDLDHHGVLGGVNADALSVQIKGRLVVGFSVKRSIRALMLGAMARLSFTCSAVRHDPDIEADVVSARHYGKDLGSGSDMTSARWWIRVMVMFGYDTITKAKLSDTRQGWELELVKELGSWSDVAGECKMLEQGYGEGHG
ncbi:Histidine Protein Methyltransferase 1-like [Manis pentadactyla]|nr:Histidine Protein Methyltransferase 1-like [Manis pentadactyla]